MEKAFNEKQEQVNQIPASEFEPLEKNTKVEREAIAAPSLNFLQDSWRRLKKNKAAIFSMVLLAIVVVISIVTMFVTPHDPTEQNVSYINLPPKIPGVDVNGWNGTAVVGGERIDKYRSEEHTSELQSRFDLVCRLLLEKKKKQNKSKISK